MQEKEEKTQNIRTNTEKPLERIKTPGIIHFDNEIALALYLTPICPYSAKRVIKDLSMMHNKKKLKLSYQMRRVICSCFSLLIPCITCKVRVSKRKDGYFLVSECYLCKSIKEIRVLCKKPKEKKGFNGKE